jgi:selenide,water dikinase
VGPAALGDILKNFKPPQSENLLVGIDGVDDAGVYKLNDDLALVLTVDFFPPIVDDPFLFGQVAAANALSDIYAMGGKPVTALNILAIPAQMPADFIAEVLRGGADKIAEAGAVIAGGHTIKDMELKYGLAVTGTIHPNKIITNGGAKVGDNIILTKPLGTGIISTAVKQNKAGKNQVESLNISMTALNKTAGEAIVEFGANAATDITGFGLGGHAFEMANNSGISIELDFSSLELLPGAIEYAELGALTGGAGANRSYLEGKIEFDRSLDKNAHDIIYDPQTSGGLLISIDKNKSDSLLDYLSGHDVNARLIGRAVEKKDKAVIINR